LKAKKKKLDLHWYQKPTEEEVKIIEDSKEKKEYMEEINEVFEGKYPYSDKKPFNINE
jgi:hypothetical protein